MYKQITQFSRPYKFGSREEFVTRDEAEKAIKKLEQTIKTEMSLNGLYKLSKVEISEEKDSLTLLVTTTIPKVF